MNLKYIFFELDYTSYKAESVKNLKKKLEHAGHDETFHSTREGKNRR